MDGEIRCSADEAYGLLLRGNEGYVRMAPFEGDVSVERREYTADHGQQPYAVVVSCSDSRVMPELIFSAGIGDLFTIRSAGNTIDKGTLGSIEYAVSHLGCRLVVIMGHTNCGAITSTIHGDHIGHVGAILRRIKRGIGYETDIRLASEKNVRSGLVMLRKHYPEPEGVRYLGAMYDIRTGEVRFFD